MARTVGSNGKRTQRLIREAAAALVARHGFDAMSMRQLAAEVGVQVAALYRYFPTKEDLLFSLLREHLEELSARSTQTPIASGAPARRLTAFLANHIEFHIARRHSTHVSNMEASFLVSGTLERDPQGAQCQ